MAEDREASSRSTVNVRTDLTVTPYPERLLAIARDLIEREEWGVAVVITHMACEIRTEQALSRSWR
jgi:hypothetical protein